KGMVLCTNPITARCRHTVRERGSDLPCASKKTVSKTAASPTRPNTSVSGGISATATLINKKDGPHKAASKTSSKKFLSFITVPVVEFCPHPNPLPKGEGARFPPPLRGRARVGVLLSNL